MPVQINRDDAWNTVFNSPPVQDQFDGPAPPPPIPEGATLAFHQHGSTLIKLHGNGRQEQPASSGLFICKGPPTAVWNYTFDEFNYVLDGECTFTELGPNGERTVHNLTKGDVIFVSKGTKCEWGSPSQGGGFWVSTLGGSSDFNDSFVGPGN
ncbi:hypothetical protein BOTBODRAFT_29015 [Botryobasidium botryosum FD-172 SS1]|uniref:(S)-ureidoglycine aminohydrolase cupin domain-containing protein n=1 Tax=Botryobasidium botryosum (strain FD-172 SS1) TaxID=930990 RepID=A0A067N3B0_BOTB1|nr:hypothetical protein BOTBODRAFT_29015 [Botryobasidium botryosum FD-172 SS1]